MVSFSRQSKETGAPAPPAVPFGGRKATDEEGRHPATVIEVLSPKQVVLNCGKRDGLTLGSTFAVYQQTGRELLDPDTGESLGELEVPRGTGSVTHLQEKWCVVTSNSRSQTPSFGPVMDTTLPFDGAAVGDKARLGWLNG